MIKIGSHRHFTISGAQDVAAASALLSAGRVHAAENSTPKVGLIGCSSRLSWIEALAGGESMAPTGYTWKYSKRDLPDDTGRSRILLPGEGRRIYEILRN